jgi:hypothetical protein
MSLEQVIQDNTAAINLLIETLKAQGASHADVGTAVHKHVEEALKEDKSEKKADTKKSTAETASSAKDAGQAASGKTDNAKKEPVVTGDKEALYNEIKQTFLDLVASDRPAAVKLLETIGAKTLKVAEYDQLLKAKELLGITDEELS